jgi:hypothetical protein
MQRIKDLERENNSRARRAKAAWNSAQAMRTTATASASATSAFI